MTTQTDGTMALSLPQEDHKSDPRDEDDPHLSSAARCISFRLMGSTFRPEFTHQCFPDGEWIRGYLPSLEALKELGGKTHSSHKHHDEESTHHLSIVVDLAPSCRTCSVSVDVSKKKKRVITRQSDKNAKRVRFDNSDSGQKNTEKENTECDQDSSSPEDETAEESSSASLYTCSSAEEDDDAAEGRTRRRRMPVEEVLEKVGKGLPPCSRSDIESHQINNDYLEEPIGSVVETYQLQLTGIETDFVLCMANGKDPGVADYHGCVQNLAMWFIETADSVDVLNQDGGHWKVLYLFCKQQDSRYSLAGYVTLFFFSSPFKKPKPGMVVRICQALVLPPFQRAGHGKAMLKAVYSFCQDDHEVVEVNVEDPAPAFVALRNRVDYELFDQACRDKQPWIPALNVNVDDESFFQPLSDGDAASASVAAKITPRQVQIAFEMYKLQRMGDLFHQEKYETKYRIMVKKRLLKVHQEDLGGISTKEAKKEFLNKAYAHVLSLYRAILKLDKA